MIKQNKIILTFLAALLALLIFAATVLPLIVRSRAAAAIADETGRTTRIEKVTINPLTLTVTVSGFSIEAVDGSPFISIGKLRATLGLASIYKGALIISGMTLETPAVTFARLAANNYSFNDIIERQKAKPKKPKSEFRFSINNIILKNGSLDFEDRAIEGGRKHTIRDLDIAIPFISNIPYLVESYTDPHISAQVNGAPFNFSGKTKPLSKTMETSVHIDLKDLNLPEYVAYSPVKPPTDLTSGRLTVNADANYRVSSDKKPELVIKGLFRLDDITVAMKDGQPLFKLPSLQVNASNLEVFARRFLFDAISIQGLELFISRNAKGVWMFDQLLPHRAPPEKTPRKDASGKGVKSNTQKSLVQITSFKLSDGTMYFSDAVPSGGYKSTATQIDAEVTNFSTENEKSADYDTSFLLDQETTFRADGRFSLDPLTATVNTELSDVRLRSRWPYMARWLTSPLEGTVDLSCRTTYSREEGLTVSEGAFLARSLSTRYGDREGFDLDRFEMKGVAYSQKKNSLEADEIRFSKGNISLSREDDGSISLMKLLKKDPPAAVPDNKRSLPAMAVSKAAAAGAREKNASTAGDFSFRFKKILIDRFNAAFMDKTFEDAPRFTLSNTSLSLTNLNGPKFTPAGMRFSATFNKDTPLKASGDITPQPFRYKGNLDISRLPLRDFEAYFPSNINVFLLAGSADTSMKLDIALKNGKPTGTFKGSAGIRAFHAVDSLEEQDLLTWESLQLDEIQGSLEPFSLALHEIVVNNLYSRIIIRKDGTLNLQNLVQKDDKKHGAQPVPAPAAVKPAEPLPVPAAQTAATGKQIRIDALSIHDGTMSFTDNHLPRRFATTFYKLGGRISGLSSEEAKFADVDLRGNLENNSPLQITGKINPLRGDLFVDLKISFQDIDLSPVTPYTGAFLGYTVEKGKLDLNLKYKIENKKLVSENRIFIDQFTFGEKVESDKATRLPVKLGLALLKDRKGEIHLDVPVTGRTDDPKFSIWKLVFQVLQNLLVKAVTSPFSLLSSMMGGGQDFSAIQFNPGLSTISPLEDQKLVALSKALLDRPALKVELQGYVDREKDTEAYRGELFNRKLRNEKFLALIKAGTIKAGEQADSVQIQPEEYATYLKAVYRKEKFPKPRNVIGLVKDLPPDEMKKLIIANTAVGEPELLTLARERVVAVSSHLVGKGTVPAERIFQKNDNIFKAPEKDTLVKSRVELHAIAQ
jgi:uncharacterized protein involved in outer membrane biogenesis